MYTRKRLDELVGRVDSGWHKDMDRDVLEFNYYLLAHHFRDYAVEMDRQHQMQMDILRRRIEGRKTVRVAEILAEAEQRLTGGAA